MDFFNPDGTANSCIPPPPPSPKIVSSKWGEVVVKNANNDEKTYKGVMIFPGGSKEWNWTESDTHHSPGIGLKDVRFLLDQEAEVIILSQGMQKRLETQTEVKEYFSKQNIQHYILPTPEAIEKYNELRDKDEAVAALIHSTC